MKVQIVCCRRYNEKELLTAVHTLVGRGHTFVVSSTDSLIVPESGQGAPFQVSPITDDLYLAAQECDGFMLTSGHPDDSQAYWNDHRVARAVTCFDRMGKPIAAICNMVPTIRAVTADKNVTCYPRIANRQALEAFGAIVHRVTMVRDANLVTGEHPEAAECWAEEFCNLLEGKPQEHFFTDTGFRPGQWQRKPIPIIEELLNQKEGA